MEQQSLSGPQVSVWPRVHLEQTLSQIEIFAFILSVRFPRGKAVGAHPIENKSVDVTTIQFPP